MPKRTIDKLPSIKNYSVGDRIKYNRHIYEKKRSGRWAVVVTKSVIKEVYNAYCVKGMTLRECKACLNKPGLPIIPIQKILMDNGWFRSHYKRGQHYRDYIESNKEKIISAICDYKIPKTVVFSYLGIPKNNAKKLNSILQKRCKGKLMVEFMINPDVDVNLLSFYEYKRLIRFTSYLMVRMFGNTFGLTKKNNGLVLDHKYSIFNGYYKKGSTFRNKVKRDKVIPIKYMAHPYNLQYITRYENGVKSIKNSISGRKLQKMVNSCKVQVFSIHSYYKDVFNLLGLEKNGGNKIQ